VKDGIGFLLKEERNNLRILGHSMKRALALAVLMLSMVFPTSVRGDAGVLIPRDKAQPDSAVLSLEEMEITIRIDNGDAKVFVRQVFANHTGRIEEGNYVFALTSRASISDFAVWDGPTRIPAVILERKRAEEIYAELKAQSIDPGLLQMGERGVEEARRSAVFSAKIVPILPYASKRMEIEYHETIPVENLKSYLAVPLRPDAYQTQVAAHLWINFELHSAHPLRNFQQSGKLFPLKLSQRDSHTVKGTYEGTNVKFDEDFAVTYDVDPKASDSLEVLTYRNPNSAEPDPTETAPVRSTNEPGFAEATVLIGPNTSQKSGGAGRNIVVLFDNSLSMQWEKLEREYEALEKLLRSLKPSDRFNVILFNTQVSNFRPGLANGEASEVQKALDFIRDSRIRGGTDLQKALDTGLAQCNLPNCYLVLLSDGGANRGVIQNGKLAAWYAARWKSLPELNRPRTYIYAVGDDANLPLLKMMARNDGVIESVLSTEPSEFKLNAFLSKIGRSPVGQFRMDIVPDALEKVYPLQESVFTGSMASWIGQYPKPADGVTFTARGVREGQALEAKKTVNLPTESYEHPQLPRLWARARVDALLEKIEKEGEDKASIDEIIQLARKYKFVTPYTSFLAVPRSLLRPRVIRPGDPILRVHTDESIQSVIAVFPFGLTKPLHFLPGEDVWQTRFLAPTDMRDGTYNVRLILRDRNGNTYRESKSFIIASTPPTLKINLDRKRYRIGETISLKVAATQSTRTLVARMASAMPVNLQWNERAGFNTGDLVVPENLPAGTYRLTVVAEDLAHNIGTQEVDIEIVP
jgi:Ca-activated chloride channel homolog